MTAELQLSLLGKLQISRDGAPVTGFVSAKAQALLVYLAVTARPHDRQTLAALLWGDMPDTEARANLRSVLSNLRKLLAPYLLVSRDEAAFNQASSYWLDAAAFEAALVRPASPVEGEPAAASWEVQSQALRQAIELYQGDFLEGFSVREEAFEEWMLSRRERLRQLAVQALHTLALEHTSRGEYAAGIDYTTRLLALEPWREEAHRQLMILLSRSDQRSAALAQYELCCRILAEELGVEPLPETTALYERLKATGTARPHNLPPQATPFVGRQAERAHIDAQLEQPACRLLTLVGSGGIGKTRLALQTAAAKLTAFQDGVFFVPLAGVNAAELLVSSIAEALQLPIYGAEDPKGQLLNYLGPKEMLLVLDNFEHLLTGADLLADLLQAAPHLKLLVTSRERLRLRDEWVLEIGGLQFPLLPDYLMPAAEQGTAARPLPTAELAPGTDLVSYSAVALFVQQAQRTQAGFHLSEENRDDVVRLCRLVNGMPLGLELAATWLPLLSCGEIVAEIQHDLDFLATSLRDVPERHRSMRIVFEHSWDLLLPEEQAAFRQLSVFWGEFQREAAIQVAQTGLATLAALVNKSLLRRTDAGRYEIHELLRQYAAVKLQDRPDEHQQARDRHCRFYGTWLQTLEARLIGPDQKTALNAITGERENVRVAWNWAIEQKQPALLEPLLHSLYLFYEARSYFQEGQEAFERAVTALNAGPGASESPRRLTLGKLLTRQGVFYERLGLYPKAKDSLERSLSLLREFNDQAELAFALDTLGRTLDRRGDYTSAQTQLHESLALYRASGDQLGIASVLRHLAITNDNLSITTNNPAFAQEAKRLLEECLAIHQVLGHRRGMAYCLNTMGLVYESLQDYEGARRLYLDSLTLFRELDDLWGTAVPLSNLGDIAYILGAYEEAKGYYYEALKIARIGWAAPKVLINIYQIAATLAKSGQAERAVELLVLPLRHPALNQAFKDLANQCLAELRADLPTTTITAALERGQTKTMEQVVTELLNNESAQAYSAPGSPE